MAISLPARAAEAPVRHQVVRWHGLAIHVVRVAPGSNVQPVARRPGRTVPDFARSARAMAAINGGYFNHSDGHPVSHVTIAGVAVNNPRTNKALLGNPVLRPILPRIFDERVEWRAVSGVSGTTWSFAPHRARPPWGRQVVHALQAGPRLLPTQDLVGEGFLIRDARGRILRDGIGSQAPAARSALGLTATGELLLVATPGSSKAVRGLTIAQLASLMRELGATEAMNLDGGSSTTLAWREAGGWRTFVGSGQGPALVHSALLVLP